MKPREKKPKADADNGTPKRKVRRRQKANNRGTNK